jgi:hypothetical protein
LSYVIFCDIELKSEPDQRRCATANEVATEKTDGELHDIIPVSRAAVALNNGGTAYKALDYSRIGTSGYECGTLPQVVTYVGPFPAGRELCVNAGIIGPNPAPYEFTIPKTSVLLYETAIVQEGEDAPKVTTASVRPAKDVTGAVDLAIGAFDMHVEIATSIHFKLACVPIVGCIDADYGGLLRQHRR